MELTTLNDGLFWQNYTSEKEKQEILDSVFFENVQNIANNWMIRDSPEKIKITQDTEMLLGNDKAPLVAFVSFFFFFKSSKIKEYKETSRIRLNCCQYNF